ncbi:MAG TPA: crossover junction endodeoxyribonuclease RuvC [Bryobacteraceae bacterium]|nr:crossover junction endodeoxyribonuclease RuvC [Bryobacteraceae bacterium]
MPANRATMRVLGIDCGTECTGYGVIDTDGRDHHLVASGVIRTSPREPLKFRLLRIGEGLRDIIREHCPDEAAVEGVFHALNVKSALTLAHARGVALYAVAEAGIELGEYSPLEVKNSVVGYGRAEKQQVQFMVQSLLRLPEKLASADASDAVAVAICHATHSSRRPRVAV